MHCHVPELTHWLRGSSAPVSGCDFYKAKEKMQERGDVSADFHTLPPGGRRRLPAACQHCTSVQQGASGKLLLHLWGDVAGQVQPCSPQCNAANFVHLDPANYQLDWSVHSTSSKKCHQTSNTDCLIRGKTLMDKTVPEMVGLKQDGWEEQPLNHSLHRDKHLNQFSLTVWQPALQLKHWGGAKTHKQHPASFDVWKWTQMYLFSSPLAQWGLNCLWNTGGGQNKGKKYSECGFTVHSHWLQINRMLIVLPPTGQKLHCRFNLKPKWWRSSIKPLWFTFVCSQMSVQIFLICCHHSYCC